jgi:hypothetical protein
MRWFFWMAVNGDFTSNWDKGLWIRPQIVSGEYRFPVKPFIRLCDKVPRGIANLISWPSGYLSIHVLSSTRRQYRFPGFGSN